MADSGSAETLPARNAGSAQEGARVHATVGRDGAGHPRGAAHVQPERAPALWCEGEERVAGGDLRVVAQEHAQLEELLAAEAVLLPAAAAGAGRPEARQARPGAIPARQLVEVGELAGVHRRDDHVETEVRIAALGQEADAVEDAVERPGPADGVVGRREGAVEAHLQVDGRRHAQELVDQVPVEHGPVGADAGRDPSPVSVVQDLEEVLAQEGLPAAEVDLEHLHARELVDDVEAALEVELAATRRAQVRRQAVAAAEVARLRDLPRDVHRRAKALVTQSRRQRPGLSRRGPAGGARAPGETPSRPLTAKPRRRPVKGGAVEAVAGAHEGQPRRPRVVEQQAEALPPHPDPLGDEILAVARGLVAAPVNRLRRCRPRPGPRLRSPRGSPARRQPAPSLLLLESVVR